MSQPRIGLGMGFMLAVGLMGNPPDAVAQIDPPASEAELRLGQQLFYDPILSGNRDTACATCHHPLFGTSDGVSLSLGTGAKGLGPERAVATSYGVEERVPRNAPALFNLGFAEFSRMFHDGRLERDPLYPGGIRTPLGEDMETGFNSVLAAQAMFPVLSHVEMAGRPEENEIARAVAEGREAGPGGAWDLLARRVAQVPDYAAQFIAVYPHISEPDDIAFTDIANALGAFEAYEWRTDNAPYDQWVRGEGQLSRQALRGVGLFYGKAKCGSCHTGRFQTDHQFHAMAAPQLGPGKHEAGAPPARDSGRYLVTGDPADMYRFRTPSLRNITLTAPYGHAGAHKDLRQFVIDHSAPREALARYDREQAVLPDITAPGQADGAQPDDWAIQNDPVERAAILAAAVREEVRLAPDEVDAIMAFLESLTDEVARTGRLGVPAQVPSGLPVPWPWTGGS